MKEMRIEIDLQTWDWNWRDWNLWSSGIMAAESTGFGTSEASGSGSLLLGLRGRLGAKESNWVLIWSAILSCSFASKTSSLRLGFVTVHCPTIFPRLGSLKSFPFYQTGCIAFGGDVITNIYTGERGTGIWNKGLRKTASPRLKPVV